MSHSIANQTWANQCTCHMTRGTADDTQEVEPGNSSPQQISSGNVKLGTTTIAQPTNDYLRGLSWGGTKWDWSQSSPSNHVLTYYFGVAMASNDPNYPAGVTALNGSPMALDNWTDSEKAAMRVALNLWTQLMGMPTEEVTDVSEANLKFYITDTSPGYLGAQYGPHSGTYQGTGIYVRISGGYWSTSLAPGGFGFITLIHELGHGLGLAHPHDTGGGSTRFPGVTSSSDQGDNNLNQNTFTVMSYIDTNSGINPSSATSYGFCKGPMAFDIATMEYLYGLSSNFQASDNTYEITTGTVAGTDGYTCIYDTGGNDLVIYNGAQAITIDLRPATIQNELGGGGFISKSNNTSVFSGLTIAQGVTIENATGGSAGDTIYQAENVNNIINGQGGEDFVYFSGNYANYTVSDISGSNDGSIVTVSIPISGVTYTDTLYNIEKMVFADGIVDTNNLVSPPTFSTYSATPNLPINSSNTTINSDLTISTNSQNITNLEVVIDQLNHTWVGDLFITLTNTSTGTSVVLCRLSGAGIYGSSGNNFIGTVFTDNSVTDINSITSSSVPHTGNYFPSNDGVRTYLNAFNGENINSTWRLTVTDTYPALDDGLLVKWSIKVQPSQQDLRPYVYGTISVNHTWQTVTFSRPFENIPVVIVSDPTYVGPGPCFTRVRNVTLTTFEVRLQEMEHMDQFHFFETCSYIAGEVGTTQLDTGNTIQFGFVDTNKTVGKNGGFAPFLFDTVNIGPFSDTACVLTQTNTFNDPTPVTTRVNRITDRTFDVALQESEAKIGNIPPCPQHGTERVAWVAMNKGTFTDSTYNLKFERQNTPEAIVTHNFTNVSFTHSFIAAPIVIVKPSSFLGANPCNARIGQITNTYFTCQMREEYSSDPEVAHLPESVSYFAIGN